MARTRRTRLAVGAAVTVMLVGCGADPQRAGTQPEEPTRSELTEAAASAGTDPAALKVFAVEDPGPLRETLVSADVLVFANRPLSDATLTRIRRLRGVQLTETMSMAQVPLQGRTLTVVAADPGSFRRFAPATTAQYDEIWSRVAAGEIATAVEVGKRYQDDKGNLRIGTGDKAPSLHIGAYAALMPRIDAVVNPRWGRALGMPANNAMLVSTGKVAPQVVIDEIRTFAGPGSTVQLLGPDLDISVAQTAYLTGGSVAEAVGQFTYRVNRDGTIVPDTSWVSEYIRTEEVPILGGVTCNKAALPQLRAALQELVDRGLRRLIDPTDFGGCYYPRFIARDPAQGLSLHSWGIAVDLNVQGNQRGTRGEIDPQVVQAFEKWGFAWGGYWNYTDPMHFEMNRIVEVR